MSKPYESVILQRNRCAAIPFVAMRHPLSANSLRRNVLDGTLHLRFLQESDIIYEL